MRASRQCLRRLHDELREVICPEREIRGIFIDEGTKKHIRRRHPYTYKLYFDKLVEVLREPDYIGIDGLAMGRFELVKWYKDPLLVALKIDEQYRVFVSSMYIIEPGRIKKRIEYGTLKGIEIHKVEHKKNKLHIEIK